MNTYLSLSLLLLLALCVVGQTACRTQRQIAAWEGHFTEGNPREEYAAYVNVREENARLLRQAVAEAATMQIRIGLFYGKDKVIPLTAAEVSAVRDIALAGQYRTHLRRPAFPVPSDTLKRWRSLPGLNIMRKKMAELDGGAVGEKSCGLKSPNPAG